MFKKEYQKEIIVIDITVLLHSVTIDKANLLLSLEASCREIWDKLAS